MTVSNTPATANGSQRSHVGSISKRPPSLMQIAQTFGRRRHEDSTEATPDASFNNTDESAQGDTTTQSTAISENRAVEVDDGHFPNASDQASEPRLRRPSRLGARMERMSSNSTVTMEDGPSAEQSACVTQKLATLPSLQTLSERVCQRKNSISTVVPLLAEAIPQASLVEQPSHQVATLSSNEKDIEATTADDSGTCTDAEPLVEKSCTKSDPESPADTGTDAMTSGAMNGHLLQHVWVLYYDGKNSNAGNACKSTYARRSAGNNKDDFEAGLVTVAEVGSIESFCRLFNWLKGPSRMAMHENLYLFKDGIRPMWEDPKNKAGGRWTLKIDASTFEGANRAWKWLCFALIGEDFDNLNDYICGAVVSTRPKVYKLQLWIREGCDFENINAIGRRLATLLQLNEPINPDSHPESKLRVISLEYSPHSKAAAHSMNRAGLFYLNGSGIGAIAMPVAASNISAPRQGNFGRAVSSSTLNRLADGSTYDVKSRKQAPESRPVSRLAVAHSWRQATASSNNQLSNGA